jgi:hypothetical protein
MALGELICEHTGRVIGQRVLSVKEPLLTISLEYLNTRWMSLEALGQKSGNGNRRV